MTHTEVLEAGEQTLSELAATANREHALVLEAGTAMVEHAIRAGEALLRAESRCEPKKWTVWLADNWRGARVTALCYMRIARNQEEIRSKGITTIIGARRHLTMIGAPHAPTRHGWRNPPTWITDEARTLHAQGIRAAEIARRLDVPDRTVRGWIDPSAQERARVSAAKRRAERRALRDAEVRRQAKRAARNAGGAMSEAYAMVERFQDVLGHAHGEATDAEARRALSVAGEHYRKMRDEIVRALGVT